MNSRKIAIAVALLAVAIGLWLALRSRDDALTAKVASPIPDVEQPSRTSPAAANPVQELAPPAMVPSAATVSPAPVAAVSASAPRTNAAPATVPPVPAAPSPERNPMIDLDKVRHMITDYHTLMGENPVGTNVEILKALMGSNAHAATLGPPEGQTLNEKGELIDLWGTPYFFHQLSKDVMEVRSAGPDKIMWTADDPVIR